MTPATTETLLSRMIKNVRKGNFDEVIKFGKGTLIVATIRALLQYMGLSDQASLRAVSCAMAFCFISMKRGYLTDMRLSWFSDIFEADVDWHQVEHNAGLRQFWRLVSLDIARFIRQDNYDPVFAVEGDGKLRQLDPYGPGDVLDSDLEALVKALMTMAP